MFTKKILRDSVHSSIKTGNSIFLYLLIPLAAVFSALTLGRYPVPPKELLLYVHHALHGLPLDDFAVLQTVIFGIRLPRIAAAHIGGGFGIRSIRPCRNSIPVGKAGAESDWKPKEPRALNGSWPPARSKIITYRNPTPDYGSASAGRRRFPNLMV